VWELKADSKTMRRESRYVIVDLLAENGRHELWATTSTIESRRNDLKSLRYRYILQSGLCVCLLMRFAAEG
jgi:hypothetical protein